jgi:hypothetical protein
LESRDYKFERVFPMTLRSAIKTLLVLVLALPIAQMVLIWVRGLLVSMGDGEGGTMMGHVGALCQAAWVLCLVGLVVVLAFVAIKDQPPEEQE